MPNRPAAPPGNPRGRVLGSIGGALNPPRLTGRRMVSNRDPVRASIHTMHASFVLMFLLMFVIFGLGLFEILAAIVNPSASIVLALVDTRSRPAPSSSYAVQEQPWITVPSPTQIFSVK